MLVVGHTDGIPIRTPRFPSNWELSQARAAAVAEVLAAQLGGSERLATDGRADTEPLAPNDTAEGATPTGGSRSSWSRILTLGRMG